MATSRKADATADVPPSFPRCARGARQASAGAAFRHFVGFDPEPCPQNLALGSGVGGPLWILLGSLWYGRPLKLKKCLGVASRAEPQQVDGSGGNAARCRNMSSAGGNGSHRLVRISVCTEALIPDTQMLQVTHSMSSAETCHICAAAWDVQVGD